MAFSPGHYRSESGGQGHGTNTTDGVQVKIGEQFVPLEKVTLPLDYKTGNPSEVLFMEYDFSLEAKVIEWTENQRKVKEALELAKQEQLKQAVADAEKTENDKAETTEVSNNEETTSVPNGTIPQGNGKDGGPAPVKAASPSGPFMNMSLDILTPTVLATGSDARSHNQIIPHQPLASSTSFNLADFENEQDPFDNLELKTLDDMAELNKVLQGAQTADTVTKQGQTEVKDDPAHKQQSGINTVVNSDQQSAASPGTGSHDNQNTRQTHQQLNDASFQQPSPLNIKDVEYPDFDTLETPDTSLSDPSYSIASQQTHDNTSVTYSNDSSTGHVRIQPGSYASVSFSNKKVPQTQAQAAQDSQRSGSPYSYNPPQPVANSYPNQQNSSAQSAGTQNVVANTRGYNYSSNKQSGSSSQQQQSVINGLTQYMPYGNNPWSSDGVNNNSWSTQASNKPNTNPWEPPKSYTTSNPWDPPSTSANNTNPWSGFSTTAQNTNPWGPPSLYANSSSSGTGMLRSARSQPDLTKLTERPVKVLPTSHTPPPTTGLSGTKTPPPRPSSNQSWNPYSILPPTSSSLGASPQLAKTASSGQAESLLDPYSGMSHEMKRFVDGIADMGFSRARVARTAQKLGQDDKKVVDHLCLVNKLAEQGLKADQAELALHLFDQQEDKAKEYIKLRGQFKELGFPDDKIQEALIKSDLDENKTLDALTSS